MLWQRQVLVRFMLWQRQVLVRFMLTASSTDAFWGASGQQLFERRSSLPYQAGRAPAPDK
jgi:hypothetical protein